ncbi:tail fiber adhesin [Escherichia phage EcS1]|uniref:Distal long tail fiber assembly catalyst n=1 Tax=Escherichia phage EcS1 TaxID=2083276 RepID=A0A2Z5ZCD4_9CAUD|nr:tail fiber adhesin [Escherichia phage EcS1]BBC78320.1 Distal long tail fiber assembly catalyst [Escherichia phage EcS1]
MAIAGPWIGSSGVAETGKRWMQEIGAAVRMPAPFWASNLGGRSVYNISFGVYERMYNNVRYRGQWGVGWSYPFSKPSGYGNVGGSFEGNAFGTLVAIGSSLADNRGGNVLSIQNGPVTNLTLTTDDGAVFYFNNTERFDSGYRQYDCTDRAALYNYLNARVGQTRQGLVTRR